MEINHMMARFFCVIFIFLLSSLSDASSIVKNLPGFHGDLPTTFETGYIGVGANDEVQFFYYFVESERDPSHDPLLLHLTGGPGTAALYPFFLQIGPLSISYDNSTLEKITLELNRYPWTKMANILFVDQPAGAGFSYATTYEGTKSSDSILAQHSYEFLRKWLEEHPRFLNNPLYIAGTSYMGIIVPVVTLEIYKANERGDQPQLNIKGYIILSPLTDKFSDFNSRLEFAHRLALIPDDIYESATHNCDGNYIYNAAENTVCSRSLQRFDEWASKINFANILDPLCNKDNPDPACREIGVKYLESYGNDKEVQKALHVREGTVEEFAKSNQTMHYEVNKEDQTCYSYDISSSIIYHKTLVSRNCQALILSADHDFTFPYVGVLQWIKSLNLPLESPWNQWFVNNQVAGYRMKYAKNGYSLTYATVKGAGHSIPVYEPGKTWVIVDEWLASHSNLSDS